MILLIDNYDSFACYLYQQAAAIRPDIPGGAQRRGNGRRGRADAALAHPPVARPRLPEGTRASARRDPAHGRPHPHFSACASGIRRSARYSARASYTRNG